MWRNGFLRISVSGSHFPTWENDFPTWGRDFPMWRRDFPTWGRDFPTWGRDFPTWGRAGTILFETLQASVDFHAGKVTFSNKLFKR